MRWQCILHLTERYFSISDTLLPGRLFRGPGGLAVSHSDVSIGRRGLVRQSCLLCVMREHVTRTNLESVGNLQSGSVGLLPLQSPLLLLRQDGMAPGRLPGTREPKSGCAAAWQMINMCTLIALERRSISGRASTRARMASSSACVSSAGFLALVAILGFNLTLLLSSLSIEVCGERKG